MALTYKIPTFEELLKKIEQPKVTVKATGDLLDPDSASRLGYKIPAEWKLGQDITGMSLISPRGNIFKNLTLSPEGKIEDFETFSAEGIKLPTKITIGQEGEITPPRWRAEPPPELPPVEPPPIKVSKQEARAIYEQRQKEIDIKYRKSGSWEFKDTSEEARQAFLAEEKQAWEEYQSNLPGIEQSIYAKVASIISIPFQIVGAQTRQIAIGTGDVGQAQVEELIKEGRIQPLTPYEELPFWEQLLWETPAFLDIYRQVGRLVIGGGRMLARGVVKTSLNKGLDKWITVQARLDKSAQSWLYPIITRNKASIAEMATNNYLARTGRGAKAEQAIREAVDEVVNMFVPKGTQTGIVRGGLPAERLPTIQSVVAKITSNQVLTTAERQLYASQAQAVEAALKAQVIPEVTTPTKPPAVTPGVTIGDTISDGLVSGKVVGEGIVGKNIPAYKIELPNGKTDLIIKDQVTKVTPAIPKAEIAPPAVAKPPVEVKVLAKAKLAKAPTKPMVKPVPKLPVERRTEIQSLLKEPAKNLPKGTTKIALRKELAQINKSLIPQEKSLRQKIMATAKGKSLGVAQSRNIFRDAGGSRYLTNLELTQLQKVLKAVQRARPVRIKGKKVITPKREALIQSAKKDLVDQGILTEATYKDILKSLKLSTDKYVDSQNFITNSQGSDIIRTMRNIAILNPLGELKFGKPTAIKYLTSQVYYAQVLGLKPLTNPLELAKVDFDLAYRAMSRAIENKLREVNKAWKTKKGETLRDLLDTTEEAPAGLTGKQKELFVWFRNLNRSIINGENEVRRAMGVEEIPYRQAYVRHIPDAMAWEIINGTHPIPPSLIYWSKKLVSKKIFNPMELHRQLSDDLAKLYSKDLAFATKNMVYTGLKEIHLAQPLRAFTERMGALSDIMPASTRRWVTDYINQVIKGQQTEWDESINAIVTESGIGGLMDRFLRPFNRTLGQRPVTRLTTAIGKGTIYAVLGLPRPRLARLMIRNLFQRTQELALHGVTPTLKSFLPDPKALKELKARSGYLKSYTGIEEWPTDLMGKVGKIPLAPYQFTAILNANRGMSAAYHDFIKFITDKKYRGMVGRTGKRWVSEQRTYTEEKGFLYPEEQELLLSEMELATRATQYQYIGMGMPEIFRHKTLIPITRLQSWWMNHFTMFHREAFHRFAYGETMSGYPLPWSSRVNWLKYLLFGGAILTSMGYGASYGLRVLPHNESPVAQFAVGLSKYVSAGSDWERTQAKRDMQYAWKAIVPGPLAIEEVQKLWTGEMPLWQMFFYGSKEEGPPPHAPDWGFPRKESTFDQAELKVSEGISNIGKFDQAELDAKLKEATEAEASPARIREIKAGDYLYDITSLRRDIGDATRNLEEDDIVKLEPIVSNYVELKAQKSEYDLLSDEEQEQYVKDNPAYTINRLFWGDNNLSTIPDLEAAEALEAQAKKYNIPLDMIPAFQLTDKGQERIPSDKNLWESYFTYYDLPGSGGYLSLSQSAVDDGRLPEEHRKIWETYQKLLTDIAKTSYREKHKKLTVNLREELRRDNPEFDQWLIDQGYNKPLTPKAKTISRARGATRMTLAGAGGGFGVATVSPRRAAPTYPTFPKPKISTGISVKAPSVPGF